MRFNGLQHTDPLIVESRSELHVTVSDVKMQLRIEDETLTTEQTAELTAFINAAIDAAQEYKGKFLALTTLKQNIYNFSGDSVKIPVSPFVQIASIKTGAYDAPTTALAATDYYIERNHNSFTVHFAETQTCEHLEIIFTAGYEANKLPANYAAAIKLKAADLYDTERSGFAFQVIDIKTFERLLGEAYSKY